MQFIYVGNRLENSLQPTQNLSKKKVHIQVHYGLKQLSKVETSTTRWTLLIWFYLRVIIIYRYIFLRFGFKARLPVLCKRDSGVVRGRQIQMFGTTYGYC